MSAFLVTATPEYADFRIPPARCCIRCRETKDAGEFYLCAYITAQGKQSFRLEPRCKLCACARRNAYRAQNSEREARYSIRRRAIHRDQINAQVRKYRAANGAKVRRQRVVSEQKRRLRGYNRSTKYVRALIDETLELARIGDRYLDAYTGELIDRPTIDHITPLSRGGEHVAINLCVTSFENNRSKRATPLLVWLLRRKEAACQLSS